MDRNRGEVTGRVDPDTRSDRSKDGEDEQGDHLTADAAMDYAVSAFLEEVCEVARDVAKRGGFLDRAEEEG